MVKSKSHVWFLCSSQLKLLSSPPNHTSMSNSNYLDLIQLERQLQIGRFGGNGSGLPRSPYDSRAGNEYGRQYPTFGGDRDFSRQEYSPYASRTDLGSRPAYGAPVAYNQPLTQDYGGYMRLGPTARGSLPFDYTLADRKSTHLPLQEDRFSYRAPEYGLAANSFHSPPPPPPLSMPPQSPPQNSYDGLGVTLQGLPDGLARIAEVRPGSPAALSRDIHPGDVLMTIDGMDVRKLTLAQAGAMLSGPRGTSVQLGLFRYVNVVRVFFSLRFDIILAIMMNHTGANRRFCTCTCTLSGNRRIRWAQYCSSHTRIRDILVCVWKEEEKQSAPGACHAKA